MPIGRTGLDFIVNTTGTGQQSNSSATTLADGRFVVTWDSTDAGDGSGGCIRGRIYNPDGSANGVDFIVNSTGVNGQFQPSVTALADGRFVVAWSSGDPGDGSGTCIRGRAFNADGTPDFDINAGNDFVVNTTATDAQAKASVTTLADGRFVVTWQSGDLGDGSENCIRGRIFNADGSAAGDGSDFIVNSTETSRQFDPTVTALPDGSFVVTWESEDLGDGPGSCVRARLFDADSSATGEDFIVNTTETGRQAFSSATALADGRFMVFWTSYDDSDGSQSCIRGRLYNSDGSASGDDYIVNTTATSEQSGPSATELADSRLLVVWHSGDPGDGSESCIRARLFNADGSPAGNDFVVNITGAGTQSGASVMALADGRFVVTWNSTDPGDGSGSCIRTATFDPKVFTGTAGDDIWNGSDVFGDAINGWTGNDTLHGLGGDDLINGDNGDDKLYGGAGNDRLFGGVGDDYLDGGSGIDRMYGGAGDDIFIVRHGSDKVVESAGQGYDIVRSTVSYALAGGAEVEELTTTSVTSTKAINLTGNSFGQKIVGNAGRNTLSGGGGEDLIYGETGNDVIHGGGHDDTIRGGSGDDTIRGDSGNDNIQGNGGNDTIHGGSGNDVINGGSGKDRLTGGSDKDIFVFNASIGASRTDTITDFKAADDTIHLAESIFRGLADGTLKSSAFKNIAKGSVDGSDRILYNSNTGALYFDRDGSGGAYKPVQFAIVDKNTAMSASDFFVI